MPAPPRPARLTVLLLVAAVLFAVLEAQPAQPTYRTYSRPASQRPHRSWVPRRETGPTFKVETMAAAGAKAPTAAQRRNTDAGLAGLQHWLGTHGDAVITGHTEVLLTDHEHCPGAGPHPEAAGVTVAGSYICLFSSDTRELRVSILTRQIAAHEAVHILQEQLGCRTQMPSWLLEGMAEDLSWRSIRPQISLRRLRGFAAMRKHQFSGPGLNYGTALRVAADAERGRPTRLIDFCRAVGAGAPWQAAFRQAFHVPPDRLAARF